MKRTLLTILAVLPLFTFAQSYTDDKSIAVGGLILFLIALGISIAIFLILRHVLLWYWKVELALQNKMNKYIYSEASTFY